MYYAEKYVDPAFKMSEDDFKNWSVNKMVTLEQDRLVGLATVLWVAAEIPRRLGDVTAEDLAKDKKDLRKLVRVYEGLHKRWGTIDNRVYEPPLVSPTPEQRKIGAQIDTAEFGLEQRAAATLLRSVNVTALAQLGLKKVANRVAAAYDVEIGELQRILPD